MNKEKTFNYKLLMFTTLIISGCSIIYEVLISSISSYLVGDSIKQFSITIGLYMCAMGIGSYLSKYIKKNLFDWFVFVELGVGVLGGISSMALFLSNIYIANYTLVMYIEIILIGILVGLEIPLLTRIIEENTKNLRVTLSSIFSFDYIGGLIGSVLFPLLLLPKFGYFTTAFLVGTLNILIAFIIIIFYKDYIKNKNMFKFLTIGILVIMGVLTVFSENIANGIEDKLYRDKIIYSKKSKYQHLVLTKHKDDLRLFINGNIQFSTQDEYRYHESLIHVPMSTAKNKKNILILGGGDGLALREILKYPEVKKVTLVDLDEEVVKLSKENKQISTANKDSLKSDKLKVVNVDAFEYLEKSKESFDVIIIDLPDPNNESLNKLYTNVFYRLCGNRLNKEGAMAIQSTSPYYAKEAFWSINKTLEEEGFKVYPYHTEVPTFGDWGFQLVTKNPIKVEEIKLDDNLKEGQLKFLTDDVIQGLFLFGKDQKVEKSKIDSNTLMKPSLIKYYLDAVEQWK